MTHYEDAALSDMPDFLAAIEQLRWDVFMAAQMRKPLAQLIEECA